MKPLAKRIGMVSAAFGIGAGALCAYYCGLSEEGSCVLWCMATVVGSAVAFYTGTIAFSWMGYGLLGIFRGDGPARPARS